MKGISIILFECATKKLRESNGGEILDTQLRQINFKILHKR